MEEKLCLFHNPSMQKILDIADQPLFTLNDCDASNYSHAQEFLPHTPDFLTALRIKKVYYNEEHSEEYLSIEELLEQPIGNANINFFIELHSHLIEVRVNNVTYDDVAAKLLSFVDCSSVQKIEKLQNENNHELRTPINAVLNSVELIKPFIPPEREKLVQIAEDSCNLILFHVNDFTDYGKLATKNINLNIKPVNIRNLVEFCLELVRFSAEQKGIQLQLDICPESNSLLQVDERRLKQVLLNLLNNAVKFTIEGKIKVKIEHETNDNTEAFTIKVMDSGMGIKSEDLEKLGTEFTMLSTHSAINPNGTGLGLYMCKKLISLMGGDLRITSVWGQGSTFAVLLPIEEEKIKILEEESLPAMANNFYKSSIGINQSISSKNARKADSSCR